MSVLQTLHSTRNSSNSTSSFAFATGNSSSKFSEASGLDEDVELGLREAELFEEVVELCGLGAAESFVPVRCSFDVGLGPLGVGFSRGRSCFACVGARSSDPFVVGLGGVGESISNQSSSSIACLLPGTLMACEQAGQATRCPAMEAETRNRFWHFGHWRELRLLDSLSELMFILLRYPLPFRPTPEYQSVEAHPKADTLHNNLSVPK